MEPVTNSASSAAQSSFQLKNHDIVRLCDETSHVQFSTQTEIMNLSEEERMVFLDTTGTPQSSTSSPAPYSTDPEYGNDIPVLDTHRRHSLNAITNNSVMDIDDSDNYALNSQRRHENALRVLQQRNGQREESAGLEDLKQSETGNQQRISNDQGMAQDQLDKELWRCFLTFKSTVRRIAIERCKKDTNVNRKFFFIINCLSFLDYLHKQYLIDFEAPTRGSSVP
ncbi:hypothetical protein M422DRAFT_267332 [Sphaerobolus stellatus SS14]|uniref:Uncharacterized protein n=1 Tax=Sphaerobolus stellatus (strain SS14) TaxID=990650 RepID=A0A0C9V066_SPHS4|nr:hypothetical protein M422DRAFT_267332 [Sphaerobolus stellatus SS14]